MRSRWSFLLGKAGSIEESNVDNLRRRRMLKSYVVLCSNRLKLLALGPIWIAPTLHGGTPTGQPSGFSLRDARRSQFRMCSLPLRRTLQPTGGLLHARLVRGRFLVLADITGPHIVGYNLRRHCSFPPFYIT